MLRPAATAILLFGSTASALACSCMRCDSTRPVSEMVRGSVFAVVEAESAELLPTPPEMQMFGIGPHYLTRYRVVDALGQDLPDTLEATSEIGDGANCGWSLPVGEAELVEFGTRGGLDSFQTSICGCSPPAEKLRSYFEGRQPD